MAVLLVAVACGKGKGGAAGGGPGGAGGGMPAMPVEVAVAKADTVRDEIAATGQIEAVQSIELRPEVEGRVVAILVREGREVGRGTALLQIDSTELAAQAAQAAAQRDLAQQDLARTKDLIAQNAASRSDLEHAEASSRSAEAQYQLLSTRLARTTVRAPFSGVVGQRFVSLGDYVNSSNRLMSLQTVNPQRASFQVPERYARSLKRGQRVTFRVGAITGRDFTGEVDFVDPVVQQPGRTILIKAHVPNPQRLLQPGMFIQALLVTGMRPNAVVVPEDAIVPLSGANFVWVVDSGKASQRQVGLGVRTPGFVEIASGVSAGEQVVVGGLEVLFPGAPVMARVVDRTQAAPTEP
ncbi:MAG TPA: efflux RND transporter periplasmic adaptor subunit [Gemmatimonadales bacterium]